ncbi:nucleotide sugar transporter SLC35D2-like [Bolinopsis microptera]|uniref:nucleotide sugar transporter SLC35D2-like n=1 Tax=Bolinopsis microptera TaxID=2820187 RepID=UPI0030795441
MCTSFAIITANKSVLTIYKFPSVQFVTLVQLIVTVIVLEVLKLLRLVTFPALSVSSIRDVMPLPLIHLANLLVGLGSTQSLSIPMFQVLRRFTVLFVMIGEITILRKRFSKLTVVTVVAMLGGVIIAFIGDLAYDSYGYTLVLLNDLFTAAYSIYLKKINDKKLMGKLGLMYYNSIVSLPLSLLAFIISGEFQTVKVYAGWSDSWFCAQFVLINVLGFVLMYSAILCTAVCGPLTYNVAGVLKSAAVTYIGMLQWFGGDYIFSWLNFFGITVSALGGVVYSAVTFRSLEQSRADKNKKQEVYVA